MRRPVQHTDGLYYQNRDGLPDTDWAFMDGVSNSLANGGSGMAMWDQADDGDTFFVRARGSHTDADDIAAGRTVAAVDPNIDIIQLQDHLDHSHEVLNLCNAIYQLGTGGDPRLCAYPESAGGGSCDTECTSGVKDAAACGTDAPVGVQEHTFVLGQGDNVKEFEVTPPNKQWHWFERIRDVGAMGSTPSAALVQVSQPMVPLPPQPITAGGLWQGDGTASP